MATFSVIIPTLNEEDHVGKAIESAWAVGASEVIVADGGSSDRTLPQAKHAGALPLLASPGRASQQNAGAAAATGDWLLFLHADTWLEAHAAVQIAAVMQSAEANVAAFEQHIDANGRIYRLLERGNAWRARRGMAYGDQGILLRRTVFEAVGGFPQVPIMEDVRLMRLLKPYGPLQLLPGPLHVSARRWQAQGAIQQTARNWAMLAAERCGVSPARLATWYQPHAAKVTQQYAKS